MAFIIDNETKDRIKVPTGDTPIGRGPFLKVCFV